MALEVYSVSEDTATGSVYFKTLQVEVEADPVVPPPLYILIEGDALSFSFSEALTPTEKSALDTLVSLHPQSSYIEASVGLASHNSSVDPTVLEDVSRGIQVGDQWLNWTTDTTFICFDNTLGGAVWVRQLGGEPCTWSYVDQTEREAATGFVESDVGKLARQLDNDSLWLLTGYSPVSWKDIAASASSSITLWDEGTPVQNTPHTTLNFNGSGVSVTDSGSGVASITISGGPSLDDILITYAGELVFVLGESYLVQFVTV